MMSSTQAILSITLLSVILVFGHTGGYAQDFTMSTYMERTHVSPKIGVSAGYRFGCSFEVGGFFQQELQAGYIETDRRSEHEFYGIYMNIPLVCREYAGLDFQVRTGEVNGTNFTITPSLHLSVRPVPFLWISAGMGVRNLQPTFIPKIEIIF